MRRFHRRAMVEFSRGFQSTGNGITWHRVASATIECAWIQASLTQRGVVARAVRALQRAAKFTLPLRGKEVAA